MKKKKKEKDKKTSDLPPLSSPVKVRIPPTKICDALYKWSGKWDGKSSVTYLIILPSINCHETMQYLFALRDAFLRFLKKTTETKSKEPMFGGMEILLDRNTLTLQSALCPFKERSYQRKAQILLDENGAIEKIIRMKKHT